MPTTTANSRKIDELMDQASESLAATRYFEAERQALKALGMAREQDDFERMARICLPLQEARRQRVQAALDVGTLYHIDGEVIPDDVIVEPGRYLVHPPRVGADARRIRVASIAQGVPAFIVCHEPMTQLGLVPIVTIGACGSVRARIDPPDDADDPGAAWMVGAIEALGDAALDGIDSQLEITRRIDAIIDRLDAIPEHEKLHQALEAACREAHRLSTA